VTELYTPAEAAERLKVTETWLKKRVAARAIPHTRVGRFIRFTDAHLTQIAADGERVPDLTPLRRRTA
jgi:excisionase family DNA binding protein